jgi:hypothetical protein
MKDVKNRIRVINIGRLHAQTEQEVEIGNRRDFEADAFLDWLCA